MFRCLQSRLPVYGLRLGVQTGFFRPCTSEAIDEIRELVKKDEVVIFMKGSPDSPRCGFSSRAAALLAYYGVKHQAYDVFLNNNYRSAVKEFSKWPTFPQIYIKGEFLGGYDLLKEKHLSGDLAQLFKKYGIEVKAGNEPIQLDE